MSPPEPSCFLHGRNIVIRGRRRCGSGAPSPECGIIATEQPKLFPILIADDDPDDRFLLEHRLRKAGVLNPLVGFRDGAELVKFLERVEADESHPCLLLLDLKMPTVDGFDILTWLHRRPRWRDLKVAVITSSTRPADRQRVSEIGVSEYLEKFPTEAALARIVQWASSHGLSHYEKI